MTSFFGNKSNIIIGANNNNQHSNRDSSDSSPDRYQPGDIVCGKVGKYPWWPCMICDPPNNKENIDGAKPTSKFFVRYFGRLNEVSWLTFGCIIDVSSRQRLVNYLTNRNKKLDLGRYVDEINDAWQEAEQAVEMSVQERLHTFDVNYVVIEAKLKANQKKRIRPKIKPKLVRVLQQKKPKCPEKSPIKYAFTELDLPFGSISGHNKCCRYCLVSNRTTVSCIKNCGNYFHTICVENLCKKLSLTITESDRCVECCLDYRLCAACSKKIEPEDDKVDCSVNSCNKLYHRTCLEYGLLSEMTRKTLFDKLICPSHLCHRCEFVDSSPKFNCSKLVHCMMCASTYHSGDWCIPAGSVELSKTELICPRHLPGYRSMYNYLPPFVARVRSDVQSEIYESVVPNMSGIVKLLPKKDSTKPVNVNWCFVCATEGDLVCCETCPSAYHLQCANLETLPDHFYCIDCVSGHYHNYGEIVWIKCGNYRWWPGQIMHCENVPDNIMNKMHDYGQFVVQFFGTHEYLWTDQARVFTFEEGDKHNLKERAKSVFERNFNLAVKEAEKGFAERNSVWSSSNGGVVKSKNYKHIKINKPFGSVKRPRSIDISSFPQCDCSYLCPDSSCDVNSDCINIQLKYECHQSLCAMKEKCQNQNFVQRNYPKQEVFCSAKCGWGLRTKESIAKNQFVNEYVGEIIDIKEAERRREWAKENNVTDFYFMELDNNRIIDAREFSNLSRFMNHSCNPNLFAEKWIVHDDQRIGLFALRNIDAGEELTFNYNLYTKSTSLLPCHCDSINCSGFLGEQPKKMDTKTKSSSAKQIKAKSKRRTIIKENKFDLDTAESISKESMTNSISTVSLCTIKSVDKQCFGCSQLCNEMTDRSCCLDFCTKIYHCRCLDLNEDHSTESINWFCPLHFCDMCGEFATHSCELCTVSYCYKHFSTDYFRTMLSSNDGICMSHENDS